ncbi:phosphatase PAP2 family protein [Candidatus Woesearchaeota archaeon]|nr:phosphatase PAP2 family protein [Candidatus Woesearchaeota archaeon]
MKKKWIYLLILAFAFLSRFYDKQVTLLITQHRTSFLDSSAAWFTNTWTIVIIFFLMATLFLWQEHKRKWITPLGVSWLISSVVVIALKITIQRVRPFESLALPLIPGVSYAFSSWNSSFPSHHASTVFSSLPILDKEFQNLKWFWIALSLLISLSRIYVGVHYLSDVAFGCLIGLLAGDGAILLEKKCFFKWKKKKA